MTLSADLKAKEIVHNWLDACYTTCKTEDGSKMTIDELTKKLIIAIKEGESYLDSRCLVEAISAAFQSYEKEIF